MEVPKTDQLPKELLVLARWGGYEEDRNAYRTVLASLAREAGVLPPAEVRKLRRRLEDASLRGDAETVRELAGVLQQNEHLRKRVKAALEPHWAPAALSFRLARLERDSILRERGVEPIRHFTYQP